MFRHLPAALSATLIALAPLAAAAQAASPQPAAPNERITLPEYRSTLQDYRPFTEEKVAPWRDSNDTVGRVGGWRVYAKEAREKTPAADQPAQQQPANPHAGHGSSK